MPRRRNLGPVLLERSHSIEKGQVLRNVIEDHNAHEQYQEYKADLENPLLYGKTEITADEPLDGQKGDNPTVQNGNWEEVD